MKKIQILMSTYNGEKYLGEQLDTILEQDCEEMGIAEFSLLVRDDGSADGTQKILQEYEEKYPKRIHWVQGKNRGVIGSFFELIKNADQCADYYAFSDQDDYWMPDKLSTGICRLEETLEREQPKLYCCRPKLVDGSLRELPEDINRPLVRPSFGNALIENVVTGCTVVMNQTLQRMVAARLPRFTTMHDRWLYLVASCFGEVIYDEVPHICYRQHGGNVMGTKNKRFAEFAERVSRFSGRRRDISRQTAEFLRIYGDLSRDGLLQYKGNTEVCAHLRLAEELTAGRHSFRQRIKLLKGGGLYRQRKSDDRIFKILILLGSY